MNRQTRNERNVAGRIPYNLLSMRPPSAHEHTARRAKRLIKPRVVDSAAVHLGIQAHVLARTLELALRLELERRRVAMRGGDLKMVIVELLAHLERDDRLSRRAS